MTDPPYGIGFQGHAWDRPGTSHGRTRSRRRDAPATGSALPTGGTPSPSLGAEHPYQSWCGAWARGCLRVLKPGGHVVSFGAPRTAHHLACGIEQAGLELRDTLLWLFGQGFPKSRNLTGSFSGWGTALKPAYEPIILARKPLDDITQRNAERHGTGALHIDACRDDSGRWPPNLLITHNDTCAPDRCAAGCPVTGLGDRARFFYCPKASRGERDAGCHELERHVIDTFKIGADNERRARAAPVANFHPTVKPLALMRWLIRLTTQRDALIIDPFCGSGSTGCAAMLEGRRFIGVEQDPRYARIARARIHHWTAQRDVIVDGEVGA
ncbi:MAG: DNA-methyltransferase [Solirubrobacteraceae bacterium]